MAAKMPAESLSTALLADGHTASNAPDPFWPPKLSGAGHGQYWGGETPGQTFGRCRLLLVVLLLLFRIALTRDGVASHKIMQIKLKVPRLKSNGTFKYIPKQIPHCDLDHASGPVA